MHTRRALPITSVFIILALLLATVGVGYGLWSKTLFIEGEVRTGNLDAVLSVEEVDQLDDFNGRCPDGSGFSIGQDCDDDGLLNDDWEAEKKDVAECVAALDEKDPQIMHVKVTNAYPSFNCFVRWNVENTGTIPIHVYGPAYFYDGIFRDGAINTPELHVNGWPPPCYAGWNTYTQLEPKETAYCNLHIHVEQPAKENSTYEFEVLAWGRQWNEIVPPPWTP